ncbi:hypothetical protein [Pseudomonas aeruginosa]|uniref:hypothetical protein n=1 Tax=Pseudomonas aeruginosa TaxID=287 RepID=UPI001F153ABA|nr:hypothetical protein [Pseudomonas aeruginosa]
MTDQSITPPETSAFSPPRRALGGASAPIVMSLGGLVGQQLAKDSAWITLPVSLFGLGLAHRHLACGVHHAAPWPPQRIRGRGRLRRGLGPDRRAGHHAGLVLDLLRRHLPGGLLRARMCRATASPAADTAEDALKAKAISWVMVGGLAGAIIGPQLVIFTRDAVAGTPYVGSFLSQAAAAR